VRERVKVCVKGLIIFINNYIKIFIVIDIMNIFLIKEINDNDYFNGYFDLMYEFSNYKIDVSHKDFKEYIKN
jgi:hypothetical protein